MSQAKCQFLALHRKYMPKIMKHKSINVSYVSTTVTVLVS